MLSSKTLPPEKKDAFTSVAIAACIDAQIAMKTNALDRSHAFHNCINAITFASSTGLMVITELQIAH